MICTNSYANKYPNGASLITRDPSGMDETFFLTELDLSKNLRLGIHASLGLRPTGSGVWIPASDHPISDPATFVRNLYSSIWTLSCGSKLQITTFKSCRRIMKADL